MRLFAPFVISLLLVMSCNNAGQSDMYVVDVNAAETIKIPVLKDTVLKYSDFCSRVEYIPLEATEQSIVGSMTKFEIASDGSFIVFDERNVLLLRFGSDGSFLNRIGRIGNKDDEYSQITDFTYYLYKNEVIVWDITKSTFHYYDLDGQYLRQSPIEWHNGQLSVLDDSHLVVYEGKRDSDNGDAYKYRYLFTSYDGNEILSEFRDNEPSPIFLGMKIHYMHKYADRILCKSEYSSKIYELTTYGLKPAYNISYSDKTIPRKWFKMDYTSFSKRLYEDSEIAFCWVFYETPNYYLVESVKNKRKLHLSVQERYDSKRTVSGSIVVNDMFEDKVLSDIQWSSYSPLEILGVSGDDVYFVLEPEQIPDDKYAELRQRICNEVTDSTERSLTLAKWDEYYKISQNENPVLLKCTLK